MMLLPLLHWFYFLLFFEFLFPTYSSPLNDNKEKKKKTLWDIHDSSGIGSIFHWFLFFSPSF
jgi:cytochrome b561